MLSRSLFLRSVPVGLIVTMLGLLATACAGAPAPATAPPQTTAASSTAVTAPPAASPASSPSAGPAAGASPASTTASVAASPAVAGSPVASPAESPSAASAASPAAAAVSSAVAAQKPGDVFFPVKVAHAPSLLFAPLYVAIEKGYAAEQGLDISLETVTAGQDAMALTANHQLDAVVAGFSVALFNAVDRGLDIKVVGSMGTQPKQGRATALMVRKDLLSGGQVKEMKDLKGKKVAVAGGNGSTGAYLLATKLRDGGLTLGDVEIVNLAFADQVQAFKQGAIDAAIPPAPFTEQIRQDGTADYFGGVFTAGSSSVGIIYGPSLLKERNDVGKRLMASLVKGSQAIQGDAIKSEENLAIFSKYTRIPVETLRSMDPYDFAPDLAPNVQSLMDMQEVFIKEGQLKLAAPLPPERWADDSFVKAAR
jgi:NitT/TauT family transport system substrate-binding protein